MIELKEDDPPTVRRMFIYFYNLNYSDEGEEASLLPYFVDTPVTEPVGKEQDLPTPSAGLQVRIFNNIAVYAIAGKYDIQELRVLAQEKIEDLLSASKVTPDLDTIFKAIFKVTPSTDTGLRKITISFCHKNNAAIMKIECLRGILMKQEYLGLGMIDQLLEEHSNFKLSTNNHIQILERKGQEVVDYLQSIWKQVNSVVDLFEDVEDVRNADYTRGNEELGNLQTEIREAYNYAYRE